MQAAYQSLIQRLLERRLDPDDIPMLVRNVFWIFSRGGVFTVDEINQRLQELGWQSDVIDEWSFRDIAKIMQDEFGSKVQFYHLSRN